MIEEDKKREQALDALAELSQEMEKHREEYEAANDSWWNSLSEQERQDAFYAVVKRIHKAELQDRGTYRYALYNVFGFDGGMYMRGMDCGYMALHNAIGDGEDYQAMRGVNRFEVIDDKGRTYVKYLNKEEGIKYALQDDNRTLKVFIDELSWKEDL
jgi:hypothetical protein